jgi:hypothetical protein
MRRFGWQIGGLCIAIGAIVALAVLVFARGPSGAPAVHRASASPTTRATPTADARVLAVEAAARRYVEAVEESARSGDPAPVDALVVPGSQAEGNAGVAADISRQDHQNFIASRIDFDERSWSVSVAETVATVTFRYAAFGHAASWPSLRPREADHETREVGMTLEFELRDGLWLVDRSS